MKEINYKDMKFNPFNLIGGEWMLVTAGNEQKCNTMTASWGHLMYVGKIEKVLVRDDEYLSSPYIFIGSTDEEKSLVCPIQLVPDNTVERDVTRLTAIVRRLTRVTLRRFIECRPLWLMPLLRLARMLKGGTLTSWVPTL